MNSDSIHGGSRGSAPRRAPWSIPSSVAHLAALLLTVVAATMLTRRGETAVTRHLAIIGGAVGLVGAGTVVAILSLAGRRVTASRLLAFTFAALFMSFVCSVLSDFPALAGVSRTLGIVRAVFAFIALPLALVATWQTIRIALREG